MHVREHFNGCCIAGDKLDSLLSARLWVVDKDYAYNLVAEMILLCPKYDGYIERLNNILTLCQNILLKQQQQHKELLSFWLNSNPLREPLELVTDRQTVVY